MEMSYLYEEFWRNGTRMAELFPPASIKAKHKLAFYFKLGAILILFFYFIYFEFTFSKMRNFQMS